MKSRHEDPVPDVQEKEKPIVIERKPMADEQVDNEVSHTPFKLH